jgi:hypothetical protein
MTLFGGAGAVVVAVFVGLAKRGDDAARRVGQHVRPEPILKAGEKGIELMKQRETLFPGDGPTQPGRRDVPPALFLPSPKSSLAGLGTPLTVVVASGGVTLEQFHFHCGVYPEFSK